ncbi:MAG: 2-phospho-L-lactate guanylyltransferase [Ignisphaera sp.]
MIVALVPIKDLNRAKSRLKEIEKSIRIEIVKAMLRDVIHVYACSRYVDKTILVTPDPSIRETVRDFTIDIVYDGGNGQIEAYLKALETIPYKIDAVIFGVADAPFVSSEDVNTIVGFYRDGFDIVLTPSIDGGTNIMLQRYPLMIELMHGKNSFQKHLARALQKTIRVNVYSTLGTSIDIDTAEDLIIAKQLCSIYGGKELCRILSLYGTSLIRHK